MLEYEWRELERLCERLADLRQRATFAQRSKNSGLVEGLKEDIARASRQREQLVQHISARLGSVSAASTSGRLPAEPSAASTSSPDDDGNDSTDSTGIIGFLR